MRRNERRSLASVPRLSRHRRPAVMVPGSDRRLDAGTLHAVHVVAGLDVAHGGPAYSVPKLCRTLAGMGADVQLLSVMGSDVWSENEPESGYCDRRFAWDYAHLPILRGLRRSSGLSRALGDLAVASDVIHNHG